MAGSPVPIPGRFSPGGRSPNSSAHDRRPRAKAAHYPVGLAMRVSRAVEQAEDPVRVPALIPSPHHPTILGREESGWEGVAVHGDVRVYRSGPLRRAAAPDRFRGADAHRVGSFGLEGKYPAHEYGIVPNGGSEAGDSLLPRCDAGLPESGEGTAGLGTEAERGPRRWMALGGGGADQRAQDQQSRDGAAHPGINMRRWER